MLCVGSNFSQGFKFSFAVRVAVCSVFAGAAVVGATITNCFYHLLIFLWIETSVVIFFILDLLLLLTSCSFGTLSEDPKGQSLQHVKSNR